MTPEELANLPKELPHSWIDDIPPYLKDPQNFDKVQRDLLDTLATTHSHSDMQIWSSCIPCQTKVLNHKNLMKKMGFKTPGHYFKWKKTIEEMKQSSYNLL